MTDITSKASFGAGRVEFLQNCIIDAYNKVLNAEEVYDNEEFAKDIFSMALTDETIKQKLK